MGYQGNATPKKANGSGYLSGKEGKKEPPPTPATLATPKKFVFGMGPKPKEEPGSDGFTPVVKKVVPLPMKQLDPKKVSVVVVFFAREGGLTRLSQSLSKQTPPPCNQFYLSKTSCTRTDCKYSHQYILTPKHLATLKVDAKKSPCIVRPFLLPIILSFFAHTQSQDALKGRPCGIIDCYAGSSFLSPLARRLTSVSQAITARGESSAATARRAASRPRCTRTGMVGVRTITRTRRATEGVLEVRKVE